jgi:putative ABC transport system permease protein
MLSALGVAVGVGALVGVLGLASTVQAGLLAQLTALGDVLTVVSTGSGSGGSMLMPGSVLESVGRIPTVQAVAATMTLDLSARRTELIPSDQTGGISVDVFTGSIAAANDAHMIAQVRPLPGSSQLPEAIVGWDAAQTLGVTAGLLPVPISIGGDSILVVGILGPTPTESNVESSVLIPAGFASVALGFAGSYDTIYVRAPLDVSDTVASLLLPTVDPSGSPGLEVTRDSSVLAAEADTATAFEGLTVALAGVGLLVAGLGVANILTISVIERRVEIGVRRALGATRASVAILFVTEGALIACIGGAAGVLLGGWATLIGAWREGFPPSISPGVIAGGFGVALIVSLLASLYPALRAAMLAPSDALRTMA